MESFDSDCSDSPEKISLNDLLDIKDVLKILPDAKSVVTVCSWMRAGRVSRSGVKVRLRHLRIGDKLYTCEKWLLKFFQDLAQSDLKYFDAERQRFKVSNSTAKKNQSRILKAKAYLHKEGLDPKRKGDES